MTVLAWFPNPVEWVVDGVEGVAGAAAEQGFDMLTQGLTAWVLEAVVWMVGGVLNFFFDATDPNVEADWFTGPGGPYAMTATIGATLLVGFVLIGITEGVLAGDLGGMARRMALNLPMSVLGMVGLVTVTQALVRLVDELSGGLLSHFQADVERMADVVASLSAVSGGTAALVVLLLGLVSVVAGLILLAELVVRAALVYIVVALAPLVFAAQLWPALRGAGRKLLELLAALIVSKLVIAVALAIAAAAAVGTGSGGEVTALPEPEAMAEDPGGSVTQAVGILLTAGAAFGVAAFSPLLVARLLPLTEAAVVAQGVKGGPVRASQQALSSASYARMIGGSRLSGRSPGLAGPTLASGSGAPAGGGGAAAGAGGGGVGAGAAAGVSVAGAQAAGRAVVASARVPAESATTAPSDDRRPAPRPTRTAPHQRHRDPKQGGDGGR